MKAAGVEPVLNIADAAPDDMRSSLLRAATALLIFSVLDLHHVSGWLGLFAASTVLCSSTSAFGGRTRRVKTAASLAAAFAVITFSIAIACVVSGVPQHVSRAIQKECHSMPTDTFEWGTQAIANLNGHRPMDTDLEGPGPSLREDEVEAHDHLEYQAPQHPGDSHSPGAPHLLVMQTPHLTQHQEVIVTWYSPHRMLKAVAELISPEQTQLCNHLAHLIADWGSLLLLAGAFVEWGLFTSAVILAVYVRRMQRHRSGVRAAAPAVVVASPVLTGDHVP